MQVHTILTFGDSRHSISASSDNLLFKHTGCMRITSAGNIGVNMTSH